MAVLRERWARGGLAVFVPFLFPVLALPSPVAAQGPGPRTFRLDTVEGLVLEQVSAEVVTHRGRKAVRLVEREGKSADFRGGDHSLAIVTGTDFQNGTIELDLAGTPRAGAAEGARGFVGIGFRVAPSASSFECFYLRPTNGRAEDQLRRNHTTQYISWPDYPWERLRKENPGQYESYVDLEPGVWTHVKIVVDGTKARLFVNGAQQPTLLVNDLKLGAGARGPIALWIGSGTEAYFANLVVR